MSGERKSMVVGREIATDSAGLSAAGSTSVERRPM
jgi:hypothetical protein